MSYYKKDQVFPMADMVKNEQRIAITIARALRDEYGGLSSAVKRIGRRTGVHPRAIRNWYEGRNAPNSNHIILLAQSSPNVLKAVLELIGRSDLWQLHLASYQQQVIEFPDTKMPEDDSLTGANSFTIQLELPSEIIATLNKRQLWFLAHVQQNKRVKAAHIAASWRVSARTAKNDIAILVKKKLVKFRGTNRKGWYEASR